MKIKITDNKGAAFQGVVVLKEILEVFCLFVCFVFPVRRRTVETEDVQCALRYGESQLRQFE